MSIYEYVWVRMNMFEYVWICMICMNMYKYVCIYVCMNMYVYMYVCMNMYVCMYAHTHTHTGRDQTESRRSRFRLWALYQSPLHTRTTPSARLGSLVRWCSWSIKARHEGRRYNRYICQTGRTGLRQHSHRPQSLSAIVKQTDMHAAWLHHLILHYWMPSLLNAWSPVVL